AIRSSIWEYCTAPEDESPSSVLLNGLLPMTDSPPRQNNDLPAPSVYTASSISSEAAMEENAPSSQSRDMTPSLPYLRLENRISVGVPLNCILTVIVLSGGIDSCFCELMEPKFIIVNFLLNARHWYQPSLKTT